MRRQIEDDDDGFGRVRLDGAHEQGVEDGAHVGDEKRALYKGLKCSKGSRQSRHRYSALQALAPKADRHCVCRLPQRGQASVAARGMETGAAAARGMKCSDTALPAATAPGGAMPWACSRARPRAVIQSVLQARARCHWTWAAPTPPAPLPP